MKRALYQIDAFTSTLFGGNPAAVCPLDEWLDDATLLAIAAENNLSETAYIIDRGAHYDLRWFTPTTEVALCGHATLASAHLIMNVLDRNRASLSFSTRQSGVLTVEREDDWLWMDLPAAPAMPCAAGAASATVAQALGQTPAELLAASRDYLAVFANEDEVRALNPDRAALMALDRDGLIVTAPGESADFVSRFFAPRLGVFEDPVTGSAHCTLVPYWAKRLGRDELSAAQISGRGGELRCAALGERVKMAGRCVLYLEGTIHV